MINRLSGFFLSQRRLLNSWELPLAGLLLILGLGATVSTLAAAPHKQKQAVNSTPVASTLRTAVPQQPTQAINPVSSVPNSGTGVPQQPTQAINSDNQVASNSGTGVPQQPTQAIDSTSAAPNLEAAVSQKSAKAVDSTSVAMPSTKWNRQVQERRKPAIAQVPTSDASIPDGTYLYGQSSEPEQFGKEYMVFEARQGKVIGAMYLPGSEYSCFYGTLDSKQMNLTVVNPYDQTAFSHTIARTQSSQVAAAGGRINLENTYDSLSYPHTVVLEGYQSISKISDNDQRFLSDCRNNRQVQVGNQ